MDHGLGWLAQTQMGSRILPDQRLYALHPLAESKQIRDRSSPRFCGVETPKNETESK